MKKSFFILTVIILSSIIFLMGNDYTFAQKNYELAVQFPGTTPAPGLANYIRNLYTFGIGIAALLAMTMIVFGAVQRIVSAGNPSKIQDANDRITQALWGLALLLGASLVLYTINPTLVGLKEPEIEKVTAKGYSEKENLLALYLNPKGEADQKFQQLTAEVTSAKTSLDDAAKHLDEVRATPYRNQQTKKIAELEAEINFFKATQEYDQTQKEKSEFQLDRAYKTSELEFNKIDRYQNWLEVGQEKDFSENIELLAEIASGQSISSPQLKLKVESMLRGEWQTGSPNDEMKQYIQSNIDYSKGLIKIAEQNRDRYINESETIESNLKIWEKEIAKKQTELNTLKK